MKRRLVSALAPDLAIALERDLLRRGDLHLVAARSIDELCAAGRDGAEICFIESLLPDGDALDALEAIRSTPGLGGVPVVLVAPPDARAGLADSSFAAIVDLPMPPGALDELVSRLLAAPRRSSARRPVDARVRDEAGVPLGRAIDLAIGGFALRTRAALPVDAELSIRIELPGREPLVARARVVRSSDDRAALALLSPSAELSEAIAVALAEPSADGLSFRPLGAGRAAIGGVLDEGPARAALVRHVLDGDGASLAVTQLHPWDEHALDRWLRLVDELAVPITLFGVPPWLGGLAGRIPAVLGSRVTIASLRVPLVCTACHDESEDEVAIAADPRSAVEALTATPCFVCGGALALVESTDVTLAFLA